MRRKWCAVLWTAGLIAFRYPVTPALADQLDKQTTVRFNQPVGVPGRILSPGTYVFKPADVAGNRDVVQILLEDEHGMERLVTSVMAIRAYRPDVPEKPMITLEERPSGTPDAVHSWFYPGDSYGWEFVYPKAERSAIASRTTPAPKPAVTAPLVRQKPPTPAAALAKRENNALISLNHEPATAGVNPQGSAKTSNAGRELPKNASDVTFAEVLGILMLASGAVVLAIGLSQRAHG
jgi:hypothetical protein